MTRIGRRPPVPPPTDGPLGLPVREHAVEDRWRPRSSRQGLDAWLRDHPGLADALAKRRLGLDLTEDEQSALAAYIDEVMAWVLEIIVRGELGQL